MTHPLTLQTILSPNPTLLTSELGADEIVMLNLDKGSYFGLEEVGKTIWDALKRPRSVAELCDVVLEQYSEVDRPTVEADLLIFLGELLEADLVTIHAQP